MEITPETNTHKPKKSKWIVIVLAAILLVGGFVGYLQYQEKQEQAEAKKKAEAKRKKIEKYGDNIELAGSTMLVTAALAEEMNNQYYTVWRSAIYDDRVEVNGQIAYDFNKAISLQYEVFETEGKLENLQAGVKLASSTMKELKNPPEKYEEAYDTLVDLYRVFQQYTSLAESPDGSLQSFSNTTN